MSSSLLEQRTPAAATEDTAYSVAPGVVARVASITICNVSGVARTVRLALVKGGGATATQCYVLYNCPLPAATTLEWYLSQEVTLIAGDAVRIYADGADVAFGVFGTEDPAPEEVNEGA